MPDDFLSIDLTFPLLPVGEKETVPDLKRLLFKGGASVRPNEVDEEIERGALGRVLSERVGLISLVHEAINGALVSGGSHESAFTKIRVFVAFCIWVDESGHILSINEAQNVYLEWSEHLLYRVNTLREIKLGSAYTYVRVVGQILDEVLGRSTPMLELTRIRQKKGPKKLRGVAADKQSLQDTFSFGRLLQDICDGLTIDVVQGPKPPVRIPLQQGGDLVVDPGKRSKKPDEIRKKSSLRKSQEADLEYEADRSLQHPFRKTLANLRIQAELLMFVAQTGMNSSNAQNAVLRSFSYESDIDGYRVREYKKRRQGEVLFEIYKEYRSHFERYLEWRRNLFPASEDRLFPVIRFPGVLESSYVQFTSIKSACKQTNIPWITPTLLRGTRVNWLLRKSGDPEITADIAQHSKRTLLKNYATPSLQQTMSEVIRFWKRRDPELSGYERLLPAGPGVCNGNPSSILNKPLSAPEPDCRRPSGCLWCTHHRDIDSLDYVWSLTSFRHLKILELSRHLPQTIDNVEANIPPAQHAINRLSEKLSWFKDSNDSRREWVEEALARIEESYYHDQWSYLIEAVER